MFPDPHHARAEGRSATLASRTFEGRVGRIRELGIPALWTADHALYRIGDGIAHLTSARPAQGPALCERAIGGTRARNHPAAPDGRQKVLRRRCAHRLRQKRRLASTLLRHTVGSAAAAAPGHPTRQGDPALRAALTNYDERGWPSRTSKYGRHVPMGDDGLKDPLYRQRIGAGRACSVPSGLATVRVLASRRTAAASRTRA